MRYLYPAVLVFFFFSISCQAESTGASGRPLTKKEYRQMQKAEKAKQKEKDKELQASKKKTKTIKSAMAAVKPTPRPDVQVEESELDELKQKAEGGDAAAMIRLGHYYMMHDAPDYSNEKTAGEWFLKAADTGDADALAWHALYEYLLPPIGADWVENSKKLREKALVAAEKGSLIGMHLAGLCSMNNEDYEKKVYWLETAARKGFVPSMYLLADTLFSHFNSVTPEVRAWAELAAKHGCGKAYEVLAKEGSVYSGPADERPKIDKARLLGYLEKELELVAKLPRAWYGCTFDIRLISSRFSWGSAVSYETLCTYINMAEVIRRANQTPPLEEDKEASAVFKREIKELDAAAKAGNTDAMAALICLGQNWNFWTHEGDKAPFDPALYREMLQKAAEDNPYLQRLLSIGCRQH